MTLFEDKLDLLLKEIKAFNDGQLKLATSLDALNTKLCTTTTVETPQAPPARCWTPTPSHDERAPSTPTATTPTPTPPLTPPSTTPTSIYASKLCFPITAEPSHASPARCSTPGRSHALEASIATSTPVPTVPSVEDDLLTTTPIKCSTQGHNPFNVMPYTSTTSPFAISAHVVEECPPGINTRDSTESMQCRYITKPTSASASDVPLCSAIDVHEIQEVFDVLTTQRSMMQWLPFTDSPDVMQSRLPWPPPKPLDFGDVISLLVCCTDGCVFDRGKNKIAKLAIAVTKPVMHLGSAARGKNNMGELTIAGKPSATSVDVLLVCDEMPSRLELYGTAVQVDRRMASNLSQHIWHDIFVPSAYNFHVTWMATFLLQNQHCVCVLVLVLCRQLLGYWRCWQYMLVPNIKVIQIRLQTKNIQRHVTGVATAHFLILQIQLCFLELPVTEKGIVAFSFGLITFAEMYASKKWTTKTTGSATCKTGFVKCCYESIKQIITTCIHDHEDKFVVTVKADGKELMGKTLMKHDRRTWLPASTALLEMMIFHLQISVQSQPPILCKVLLIQISFLWDQMPPFSWCLFRASNGWECHSNCRADAATFYNCTCNFDAAAANKLAYIILLTLLDGLATGYVRPCTLGNQTHTSQYVKLVLLSNRHWSGIFLHKGMSSGWYNWADNSNCMIMQLKRSGPLEINIYLVNSGVQINISPGVTMDIHITFCFPILLPWSTAEVIQIILHVQNIHWHAAMGKSNSEREKIQSKIHLPTTALFGGLVVVLSSNLYLNYGQLIELHGNRWSFCQFWKPPCLSHGLQKLQSTVPDWEQWLANRANRTDVIQQNLIKVQKHISNCQYELPTTVAEPACIFLSSIDSTYHCLSSTRGSLVTMEIKLKYNRMSCQFLNPADQFLNGMILLGHTSLGNILLVEAWASSVLHKLHLLHLLLNEAKFGNLIWSNLNPAGLLWRVSGQLGSHNRVMLPLYIFSEPIKTCFWQLHRSGQAISRHTSARLQLCLIIWLLEFYTQAVEDP